MQMTKKSTMTIIIAVLLVTSMASAISMQPTVKAHDPPWAFPSYAYIVPAPDPIGVGQRGAIVMWVDYPISGASVSNDRRRIDYTLTITKPDGTTDTQHWDIIQDTTSIQYYQYTPTQVGTYMLKFDYGGQTFTWADNTFRNDTYAPASRTINWTVQDEPVPAPISSYPLPTEYWTHPIEGQNTDWWTISSNWLGSPQIVNRFQPSGLAPNSAHIMWSKSIQQGGVMSGYMGDPTSTDDQPVKTWYMGGSYNVRWGNPLIMNGKIYYELPWGNSGSGGGYVCNDLRTGKELWRINTTQVGVGAVATNLVPSFGWIESFDDGNQHGGLPNGVLVATSGTTWYSYDPDTGTRTTMNITNVPSGTSVQGPKGSILRYAIANAGSASSPDWRLTEWNSTKLISSGGMGPSGWYTGTINASSSSRYDFNKSITLMNSGSWSINSNAKYGGYMILTQGSFGGRADNYYGGNWYGANITCISLKPETMGQVLWAKYFPAPPGNVTRDLVALDHENGVFIFEDRETQTHTGFSLKDGNQLWGPTEPVDQYDYFRSTTRCAYGNFYFGGYGGILYCYDTLTGKLKWTYGNGGEGNSTASGLVTAWGHYPIFLPCIGDGKIYLATTEHSPNSPYYKGAQVIAVNATSGEEIWTLSGWGTGMDANYDIIADGFYAYFNGYDQKVYVVGKGPSETSVSIEDNVLQQGNSVLIEGSVIDTAAGTQQDEQIARFPAGVPAVSDKSQKGWMEYVYMQKPRPTDTVGVDVTLIALDPNNNYREIGKATTDQSGKYSILWQPDVPGKYTVTATFGGSESYWPSWSEAAFGVTEQPATTTVPEQQITLPPTEMYFAASTIAIVIAIAIATVLIIKKR